ncbi:MAG TPA: o-succinylbenzoate synthase [Bacteroidales bacterium]|nr:o-succinylbenzoate synthase [Bacteroidales bacterium]
MKLTYIHKQFYFNFPAYTSRGTMLERDCWFLILHTDTEKYVGECAPLPGLSKDAIEQIPGLLEEICSYFNQQQSFPAFPEEDFPSVTFAIECLQLQVRHARGGILYPSPFTEGKKGIAINGLIWAGTREQVLSQVEEKIEKGFPCIKMKIGALSFAEELDILVSIRKKYPDVEIRLDANGAFSPADALLKLEQLSQFNIHSIEQPIAPGQWPEMKRICEQSPIPIALDEELILIVANDEKIQLLDYIRPAYIILKPTLLGGFLRTEAWIKAAESIQIGWWVTSALESNVGLNAIAQWTYHIAPNQVHGLGTGRIYKNNIPSPLWLEEGKIFFRPNKTWNFNDLFLKA